MSVSNSTVEETFIEDEFRIIKVNQYGAKTADECSPFGIDSNPVEGMDAIFAETEVDGEPVIIGYLQRERLSEPGETRFYSLDEWGEEVMVDIRLRNDGTVEIAGDKDNFVSYKALNTELLKHNQQLMAELQKIATAIGGVGGVYTPGQVELDISLSKTVNIKCLTE